MEEGWNAHTVQLCEVFDLPDQGKAVNHCNHSTSHVQVHRASAQVNSGQGVKCTGLFDKQTKSPKLGSASSLPAPGAARAVQGAQWGEALELSRGSLETFTEHLRDQVQHRTYSVSAVCHPLQNLGNVIIVLFPSVTKTGGIKCGFVYWLYFLDTSFSATELTHFALY